MDFQRIELAGAVGSKEELEVDFKKLKQIKNRMKKTSIYQYGIILRMVLNETKNKLWNRVYSILLFMKEKQEDNTYLPVIEKINME